MANETDPRSSADIEALADGIVREMHSVLPTQWDRDCLRAKALTALRAVTEPQPPREGLAAELMAFHDLCTQNSAGGDGEYRVECSSGSGEQARALRAVLREAAAALALSRPHLARGDK